MVSRVGWEAAIQAIVTLSSSRFFAEFKSTPADLAAV